MTEEHLRPGVWDEIPSERYHADPCPEPSLSAGIAKKLLTRSPMHAAAAHPRLNPDFREEVGDRLDFGNAAHALLLQGLDICQEVKGFDNWQTKAAREARDDARRSGLVPLLTKDYTRMCALVEAVKVQTARHHARPIPLREGKPEQTLIWKEGDVWCRARLDWLHLPGEDVVIDDLKTTGTSANPHVWSRRRLFEDGYDVQCALYRRGLKALTGEDADWRFVVVEVDPPFAVSVISLVPAAIELAERKVDRALELFKRSLDSGEWEGYPLDVAYAELPPWEENRYLEQHYEEGVPA